MVTIPVNTQTKPVEYLVRKFAINHGLPRLAKLIDPNAKFPVLTGSSANALAAVALLKLRVAENGKAQAAGAEWDAEVAAAQAFADAALAAVSASQAGAGFFPTPARIADDLDRYAARKGLANWAAPGAYDVDAFTHANTAPVAAALTPSVDTATAIDIDLLSGATDAEGDDIEVARVSGKNFVEGETFTIADSNGVDVVFTMAANGHVTAPVQAAPATIGPFVAVLYDGRTETNRNVTVTITAAV